MKTSKELKRELGRLIISDLPERDHFAYTSGLLHVVTDAIAALEILETKQPAGGSNQARACKWGRCNGVGYPGGRCDVCKQLIPKQGD